MAAAEKFKAPEPSLAGRPAEPTTITPALAEESDEDEEVMQSLTFDHLQSDDQQSDDPASMNQRPCLVLLFLNDPSFFPLD